jgi:hypothetical protein
MEQIDSRTIFHISNHFYLFGKSIVYTFRDGQGRAPLITQDVETDRAVGVDVGVIDAGDEVDLWWLEGVVGWKVDC